MLDIQGQSNSLAPAPPTQTAAPSSAPQTVIPSVNGNTTKLTEWTAVAVVLIVVLVGGYLSFVLSTKQAEAATETRKLNDLKKQLGTPDRVKVEAIANQLKAGADAVKTALATPSPWSGFLKELTSRIPSGVALTNVSSGDGFAIRLSGTANTYQDLAEMLTALQSSSQFTQVTLESGSQGDSGSGSSVSFSMKMTYVPPTSATTPTGGSNGSK